MLNKTEEENSENVKKGIPLYIDRSEPKIYDPGLLESDSMWRGSNKITFQLLKCLEALRDISVLIGTLANFNLGIF
jgi:hypothetical protein